MKKIFLILSAAVMMAASSCAQDSKPAGNVMTQEEINAALTPFFEKLNTIPQDDNMNAAAAKMSKEFTDANPNAAGVYVIRAVMQQVMPLEEVEAYVDANEYFRNDSTIIELKKTWAAVKATSEGKMFTDFEAEYNGKVAKLSDYVGKGKYVLVDFWASWCGPCRREIPNLIKIYDQYKGDKFEVLGVATWDKPADTEKAIEQLGIKYPQIMNAQQAGSAAYGISGIPEIILFGPDGTILKRGLRGEEIEKAVANALK